MPLMRMNRNWRIATLFGHTVLFEKGVEKYVPDDQRVVEACLAAGAEYVNEADVPTLPDMDSGAAPLTLSSAQRKEKVLALFQEMAANQAAHRENFTAFGRPSAKFVSSSVGFEVPAKEVESLWAEFRVAQ